MTAANVIAVFARAPQPGKVKTRLAHGLGEENAKRLYVAMLRDTLHHAQAAAQLVGDCDIVVAFTPEDAFDTHPTSLAEFWSGTRLFQGNGDLGEKMHHIFETLFRNGAQKVVVIGSDMPTLNAQCLAEAFDFPKDHPKNRRDEIYSAPSPNPSRQGRRATISEALTPLPPREGLGEGAPAEEEDSHSPFRHCMSELTIGPAHDGGFYLIGANAPFPKQLIMNVQWSSNSTLQQVLSNAQYLNLNTHLLPAGGDVDTIEDLRDLALRLRHDELQFAAPHTFAALRRENLL